MVEEYIGKMITSINDEYYEGQRKQAVKESILNALIIATSGVGIICMFGGNIGVGLGLITASMGITGYRVKIGLKYEKTLKRLEQEKRHLRNNGDKEIYDDKDEKRSEKIRDLSIAHLIARRRYENANELTMLTYGLIAFGAISTAFNPVNVWLPVVSVGLGVAATINEVKKYRKTEILNNRVHNLKYDFEINQALIEEKQKTKSKVLDEVKAEEVVNRIDEILEKNGVVIENVSEEEENHFDSVINSICEIEKNNPEIPKTYFKDRRD